jgi:hypothetical protein
VSKDILAGCVPLKRGEYDLVNISLIGHDPITGRSFDECSAEWNVWLEEVKRRHAARKWWQLREYFRMNYKLGVLGQRQGMGN